jgi:hypothetical protein
MGVPFEVFSGKYTQKYPVHGWGKKPCSPKM